VETCWYNLFASNLARQKTKADEMMLDISDALPVCPLCGDAPYNLVVAGCNYPETPWLVFSFTVILALVRRSSWARDPYCARSSASNVIAMVMREVMLLIGAGLAAGMALALALADLIRSQLYGLNARDPFTFVGSAIVLTVAAGLAGFIPALRASGVDPTTALRQE
jgi:hypothetical protein